MARFSTLPFLLAASLLAASCGSSDGSAVAAKNETTSVTEAAEASQPIADEPSDETTTPPEPAPVDEPTSGIQTESTAASASTGSESSQLNAIMAAQSEVESGRFVMTADISGGGEGGTIEMSGSFNNADRTSEVSMDLAAMAAIAGEEAGAFALMLDEAMVVRTIGNDAYASGGIFSMFTGGEGWVVFGADEASEITDELGAGLKADELFTEYEGQDVTMTEIGRETIEGVETTHYTVTVPDDEIANLDVWVDDNDLLRKVFVVQTDDDTFGPDTTVTITMHYLDLGEPIEIVAPPADEVIDGSQISAMFGE